jgi:hypothetical protein
LVFLRQHLADGSHFCNNPPAFVYLQGSGAEKNQIVKKSYLWRGQSTLFDKPFSEFAETIYI